MLELFDDDFDAMDLVEGALVLNKAIDQETQIEWAEKELLRMLHEAESYLDGAEDHKEKFAAFIHLFYQEWGFCGDHETYFDAANGFIDKVLRTRKGIPVSLGALLLFWGQRLGFPLKPVMFPTQFLLQLQWDNETPLYLNPFSGEFVSKHTLQAWLIGHQGPLARLNSGHLETSDNPTIIGRWLALLKNALMREEDYTLALKCTDLALTFVPDDPYEIRDRGFIYQQLDCHQVALSDYQYFIEHCPDDPAADLFKNQVSILQNTPIIIH